MVAQERKFLQTCPLAFLVKLLYLSINLAQNYYIKMRYPVYSKEKNSLVVFQFAEEYRDKAVASEIIRRILLEEDVCFIKEKIYVLVAAVSSLKIPENYPSSFTILVGNSLIEECG